MEDFNLNSTQQKLLLDLARRTIQLWVTERQKLELPPVSENKADAILNQRRGAFVTIKLRSTGDLRGCIGHIAAIKPLLESVREMAIAASTEDPRFKPITSAEVNDLKLEITVLSPFKRCEDPGKVVVGTHGLLIKQGFYQGLLLPQVPVEYGWDRETFLDQVCVKAGLPPGAWKSPKSEIQTFTGQVFGED